MSQEQSFIDRVVSEIKKRNIPIHLIYDLGAHKLDESIALSQAFPDAKIQAWEANPELWPICETKATDRIKFIKRGISDRNGEMNLFVTDGLGQVSFQSPKSDAIKVKSTIAVPVERLDSHGVAPDLIWADIQGHEYNAFVGLGEYLKDVSIIATELYLTDRDYDLPHGFDEVDELLKEHFDIVAGNPFDGVFDNFIYVNRRWL